MKNKKVKLIIRIGVIALAAVVMVFAGIYTWAFAIFKKPLYQTWYPEGSMTFAWMTDTQWMMSWHSPRSLNRINAQTNFIARGYREGRFDFAVHTGDMSDYIHRDGPAYDTASSLWRISTIMRRMDRAGMPYGVLAGNHDMRQITPTESGGVHFANAETYQRFFGEHRFRERADAHPTWNFQTRDDNLTSYHTLVVGGHKYIFIMMSTFMFTDADLDWLEETLDYYDDHYAIFLTHAIRLGRGDMWEASDWERRDEILISAPNLIGIMWGHWFTGKPENPVPGLPGSPMTDGEARHTIPTTNQLLTAEQVAARPEFNGRRNNIVGMFYNHQQNDASGRYGFTRVVNINPADRTITLETYSNVLRTYVDWQQARW